MTTTEKFMEALQDQEFAEKLLALETAEEAQAMLKEKGIEVSLEDLKAAAAYVGKSASGELSEDDLEDVAGGSAAQIGLKIGQMIDNAITKLGRLLRIRW